ncbi:MAG: oxaloacetate decarboxylase [Acidimicrobiales bacterium]
MTPGARFRELLAGAPFVAADCYSALTARIVQDVGFPAAYMGGHSTSMMHYAIPDYGVFTPTEMAEIAGRVAEAIDIPLVVDADEGGESVASVHRSIRRYERAGLAGVHIEDEVDPKHSPWDGPLLPVPDLFARVATAVEARRSDDFVVIVRSNEFQVDNGGGTGSLDEMIRRARAAADAGADAFIPTFADEQQLAAIAAEVSLPLGGYQALIPGLRFTLFTGWGVWAAAHAHRHIAAHIFEHGDLPPDFGGDFERRKLTDQSEYDDVIRRWAERTGRPTRPLPW